MTNNDIGIYIHIPFCERKCRYCGFLSFPGYPEEMYEEYTDAAVSELKSFNEGFTGKYTADTVFIGGGTPSLLSGEQIERLVQAVRDTFGIAAAKVAADETADAMIPEITIEANPNSLTAEKLAAYRKAGITRLSMGAQSFSDRVLDSLGRVHKAADISRAFRDARAAGFDNINLDLMFAVPDQTMEDLEDSLRQAVMLGPEHISLYGLQLEEDTIFYEEYRSGIIDLPDEKDEEAMYHAAAGILGEAGYGHYEISNYAKPGYECRHNLKYWEMGNYIGIGPGAHSYIRGSGKTGERRCNVTGLSEYIDLASRGRSAADPESRTVDSVNDAMGVFVFTGLRKLEGIDLSEFERWFGRSFFSVYKDRAEIIKDYIDRGLMKLSGSRLSITEEGVYVSNDIMSEFIL